MALKDCACNQVKFFRYNQMKSAQEFLLSKRSHCVCASTDICHLFQDISPSLVRPDAKRMKNVPWQEMHGSLGEAKWAAPIIAVECDEEARPGYTSRSASEFVDDPVTLSAKVKLLADLLRKSSAVVAYTGAGISTSSGIGDYATKAKASIAKTKKKVSALRYRPSRITGKSIK